MSDTSPEQIKREIEQTRAELSGNVNALTEKVSPSRVVGRQVQRTRSAVTNVKERVMGSDEDPSDGGALSAAASSVADAASSAPTAALRQAQGNPLAAALIAFGAGWLASSLLPASQPEQQLAAQVKDKATDAAQPLVEQAKQAGKQMASNLQEPAQQAVDEIRASAQDAASAVAEQAKSSASDVQEQAQSQSPPAS